jgi:hypothetical protein
LLILPILNIYRKYYGLKVAAILTAVFYVSMAGAALVVETLFAALHLIPAHHPLHIMQDSLRWNYTTVLNIFFLLVSAALLLRFLRTGGPAMLREMGNAPADPHAETHSCCHEEPVVATHTCCDPELVAAPEACCHAEAVATPVHAEPEPALAPTTHHRR